MIVRPMTCDDLETVLDLQQAGAIVALAEVFPQDRFPFPRESIVARWREEIADPAIETYVAVDDEGDLVGFAATTGPELLHFGTRIDTWGRGVASQLHDVVVCLLRARASQPVLFVFAGNRRARAFYERHGWRATGISRAGDFPPYPTLLEYTLPTG